MAAFFEGHVTCDYPGCTRKEAATFELRYGWSDPASLFIHRLPEGWVYKTSWYLIKNPMRCPEHSKEK